MLALVVEVALAVTREEAQEWLGRAMASGDENARARACEALAVLGARGGAD